MQMRENVAKFHPPLIRHIVTSESTTFERQELYNEVWTEPMTTVAKRYEISDVGLRKICVKLDIPVPARGYWAQLAAGQKVEQEPLPKSDVKPTIVRSRKVEKRDHELESRVAGARLALPIAPTPDTLQYQVPKDISRLGPEANQIAKATARLKEQDGVMSLPCGAWAELSVSGQSRPRALLLLDQLAFAVKAAHGIFDLRQCSEVRHVHRHSRDAEKCRGCFQIHGTKYFVRVKERVIQEEIIEPQPLKPTTRGRPRKTWEPNPSAIFRPKKYSFTPTGKLRISIIRNLCSYEIAKTEDTANTIIEDKLSSLIEKVETLSLTEKMQEEIRREKQLIRDLKTKDWQAKKAKKDALLKQLGSFERMAQDLDRAESLRRLAKKIQEHTGVSVEFASQALLMTNMADWLDPIVAKHWPEVDEVPDNNPHFPWY